MDLSKLKPSDWLVGGGAVLFLISMFLPWYGLAGFNNSGLDYFFGGILPLLLIAAVFVVVGLPALGVNVTVPDPIGPLPKKQAVLIAAGAAAVLVVLRLIIGADEGAGGFEVDLDRKYGLFLAVIAAIAVVVGVFMKQSETDSAPGAGSGPATPF